MHPIGRKDTLTMSSVRLWLTALLSLAILTGSGWAVAQNNTDQLFAKERAKMQQARNAMARGDTRAFSRIQRELKNYPLAPYLEYWQLESALEKLHLSKVNAFLDKYANTAIGDWTRIRLLRELGERGRFDKFLEYYRPELADTRLKCFHADAISRQGKEEEAWAEAAELWGVGQSQPEACDTLFANWEKAGQLTPELAWKRHTLAVEKGNLSLASYIARKMTAEQQKHAQLMREVHRSPALLMNFERFINADTEYRDIVLHGLKRLARSQPSDALQAWYRYEASYLFPDDERNALLQRIATGLARKNDKEGIESLLAKTENFKDPGAIEWMIRRSLRDQNWPQVEAWIERLPEERKADDRWQYWAARAMEKRGEPHEVEAKAIYEKLAGKRSFYGFLSADKVSREYNFQDNPAPVDKQQVADVATKPELVRARELKAINELFHARREWRYGTRDMEAPELLAAGRLANEWGWYRKAIQSVMRARHEDDLELRFPLAYPGIVDEATRKAGQKNALDEYFVYAITRQESHFAMDAKSSAGAMGLMQLLPSTAKQTAKIHGVPYRRSYDLLKPHTNITLGSHYLGGLLKRFDNNRFLAAAAYNAGPTRVKRWLAQSDSKLPYDIWIETIPFNETRNYVQNVLTYSVIYAYRNGEKKPLLNKHETRTSM